MRTVTNVGGLVLATAVLCGAPAAWAQQPGAPPPGEMPPASATAIPHDSVLHHGTETMTTCPPMKEIACKVGIFGQVDYLYVRPRRRPFDYAILDPNDNGIAEGIVESLAWEWTSAIRGGAGLRMEPEGIEAGFYYTNLHSAVNKTLNRLDTGTLYATLAHPGTVEQVDRAFAATSVNYNVFDVEFARRFEASENAVVRLFAGPRFARITQHFSTLYDGGDANFDFVSSGLRFHGGGARVGGELNWVCFGDELNWVCFGDFALYGRANASLLLGQFKSNLSETNDAGATAIVNVSEKFDKVIPVLEVGLGVSWQYGNFRVRAGYEFVNWFGMVDGLDFGDDVHQGKLSRRTGDLSLDGLAVRAEVGF